MTGETGALSSWSHIFLNCSRNIILSMPPAHRKEAALREVKMLVVPKALRRAIFDSDIPDLLVSEEMAERYLEITPPVFSLVVPYQSIVNDIEQSYVTGNDFSALSASCVVIERLLNQARTDLHKHHKDRIVKSLWDKGPTNEWYPNIEALKRWGYFEDALASDLCKIYREVRCRYLHGGEIRCLRSDALRAVTVAYQLMKIFIGFPEDLFSMRGGRLTCNDENDPRFLEFYKPHFA